MAINNAALKRANEIFSIKLAEKGLIHSDSSLKADNRLVKTMKTAKTLLLKDSKLVTDKIIIPNKFVIDDITKDNVLELMSELEKSINSEIKNINLSNARNIALKINFWGGGQGILSILRTGQSHFIADLDFDWNKYIQLHNMLDNQEDIVNVISQIDLFNGLGISFYSKHLHFLSANTLIKYPIYDTLISKTYFARNPVPSDYMYYFDFIENLAVTHGVSNQVIERFLFNSVS